VRYVNNAALFKMFVRCHSLDSRWSSQ